jgi:hypothetical protein
MSDYYRDARDLLDREAKPPTIDVRALYIQHAQVYANLAQAQALDRLAAAVEKLAPQEQAPATFNG